MLFSPLFQCYYIKMFQRFGADSPIGRAIALLWVDSVSDRNFSTLMSMV